MTNIKKVAAGIIVGAALTSAPLVALAAPAFAATGAGNDVQQQHVLVNNASTGQSDASRVLVNSGPTPGSFRDGNAARCGGGINC